MSTTEIATKDMCVDRLVAFALSNLPIAGQQALAKHSDMRVRKALASSTTTHSSVIDTLVKDDSIAVAGVALARTTTADREEFLSFTNYIDEYSQRMETQKAALRNPLASHKMLTEALSSNNKTVELLALMNPTTPETERKHMLRSHKTNELCNHRGTSSENSFKTFELLHANPWLIEKSTQWGHGVRSAITRTLDEAMETVVALQTNICNAATPRDENTTISNGTKTNLSQKTNPVEALIHEINKPDFTLTNAVCIMNAKRVPKPQVIGRLINRYGLGPLFAAVGAGQIWHSKEMFSAALIAPAISTVTGAQPQVQKLSSLTEETLPFYRDVAPTCQILGDSAHQWETFLDLLPNWHGNTIDAAQAACNI